MRLFLICSLLIASICWTSAKPTDPILEPAATSLDFINSPEDGPQDLDTFSEDSELLSRLKRSPVALLVDTILHLLDNSVINMFLSMIPGAEAFLQPVKLALLLLKGF